MEPTRVLCISALFAEPIISLRIRALQQAGFDVEEVAFKNSYYPPRTPDHRIQSLGRLYSKAYWLRIPEIMTRVFRIRAAMRRNDIVYAFYLEMALAALMAGIGLAKPIVLEIHDIRRPQVARGLKGRLARFADKLVTAACSLLVLTTRNYRAYYHGLLNVGTPVLTIENKVDASFAAAICKERVPPPTGKPLDDRPLRIGYFGLLKDEWSLRLLETLTTASDGFEVVLAGAVSPKIRAFDRFLERNPDIEYRGAYRCPEDLPGVYTNVDMVLACYPPVIPTCWAQSNRYYQACLFRKPVIVRAGTGDADEVNRHQIGLVIAEDDVEDAATAISGITGADWARWQSNMAALPPEVYAQTGEDVLLLRRALREAAGIDSDG